MSARRQDGAVTARPMSLFSRLRMMPDRKIRYAPFLALVLIFIGLAVPLILGPDRDVFDARDEQLFHYPTILEFTEQFPHLDLRDYPAATAPFYHIFMVLTGFALGGEVTHLRLVNLAVSVACLLVVFVGVSRRGGVARGLLVAALLALSPYFIGSAIRLSTDNAALFLAVTTLMLMEQGLRTMGRAVAASATILFAIATRQIYAWLIGVYALGAWASAREAASALPRRKTQQSGASASHTGAAPAAAGRTMPETARILAGRLLPASLPLAGLGGLLLLWRGPTPPSFKAHIAPGVNLDILVFVVALVGLYGSFFIGWFWEMTRERPIRPWMVLGVIGLAAGILLLHPVSNEYPLADKTLADRGGALWLVASRLPVVASSALVFWALLPLGFLYLLILGRDLLAHRDWLLLSVFILWLLANLVGTRVYQKYYDPFLIFWLGCALAVVPARRRFSWTGPLALLGGQSAVTLFRFFS